MRKFPGKVRKSFLYSEKGFTLIELLITIAILYILAGIVIIPNVARIIHESTVAAARAERAELQVGVNTAMSKAGVGVIVGGAPDLTPIDLNLSVATENDTDLKEWLVRTENVKGEWVVSTVGTVTFHSYPGLVADDMP